MWHKIVAFGWWIDKFAAVLAAGACIFGVSYLWTMWADKREAARNFESTRAFYRANFEGRTFQATIDDRESILKLVGKIHHAQRGFGYDFNTRMVEIEPLGSVERLLVMRRFNAHIFLPDHCVSDAELLTAFAERGWRAGTLPELLAFHIAHPEFPALTSPSDLESSIVSLWKCKTRVYNFDERSPQWSHVLPWRISAHQKGHRGIYGTHDYGEKGTWRDTGWFFFAVEQETEK